MTDELAVLQKTLLNIQFQSEALTHSDNGNPDLKAEIKVAEEFWNFLGGENAYQDLLDSFERVGISMRDEIDEYFRNFQ